MKAPTQSITDDELHKLKYPIVGSFKIDGIRAIATGKEVLSNSLKRIGNKYVQDCLTGEEYEGLDGELVVGCPHNTFPEDDVFNRTTGPIRRADGKPDFKYYVFDDWRDPGYSYQERWIDLMPDLYLLRLPHIVILDQRFLYSPEDVINFEEEAVRLGYEGIMPRSLSGHYKENRATFKEALIFKRKPLEDDEAIIVGFEEQMENLNEKTTNELGTSSRSGHKENLRPKGTLGAVILKSPKWKETFNCAIFIGKDNAFRQYVWDHQKQFLGKIVVYKFQRYGSIDKPRTPRIKGFRDEYDMDTKHLAELRACL
jgi:DNA ligase-1